MVRNFAQQHDVISIRGCRNFAGGSGWRQVASRAMVGHLFRRGRIAWQRHLLQPPVHHAIAFGEKAMAAQIHAIALTIYSTG
jgi:hypothetical protein